MGAVLAKLGGAPRCGSSPGTARRTSQRLREAAETGQIAYVAQGRSAKRGRAR